MNCSNIYFSNSVEETLALGEKLAQRLKVGDVVALNGDLGAGKTCFAQGIARGLGVKDYVTSPTFTIMNVLEGRLKMYHFDVFRIDNPDEMEEIGFREYVFGDGICVIEWSDLISKYMPDRVFDVRIFFCGQNARRIELGVPE